MKLYPGYVCVVSVLAFALIVDIPVAKGSPWFRGSFFNHQSSRRLDDSNADDITYSNLHRHLWRKLRNIFGGLSGTDVQTLIDTRHDVVPHVAFTFSPAPSSFTKVPASKPSSMPSRSHTNFPTRHTQVSVPTTATSKPMAASKPTPSFPSHHKPSGKGTLAPSNNILPPSKGPPTIGTLQPSSPNRQTMNGTRKPSSSTHPPINGTLQPSSPTRTPKGSNRTLRPSSNSSIPSNGTTTLSPASINTTGTLKPTPTSRSHRPTNTSRAPSSNATRAPTGSSLSPTPINSTGTKSPSSTIAPTSATRAPTNGTRHHKNRTVSPTSSTLGPTTATGANSSLAPSSGGPGNGTLAPTSSTITPASASSAPSPVGKGKRTRAPHGARNGTLAPNSTVAPSMHTRTLVPTLPPGSVLTQAQFLAKTLTTDGSINTTGSPQNLAFLSIQKNFAKLNPNTSPSSTQLTQIYALEVLFFATSGAAWTKSTGWTAASDPCLPWVGVTCDASGNITSLSLAKNALVGRIPSEIRGLSNLRTFAIYPSKALSCALLHATNTGIS
jgi:hypothetical protein